MDKDASELAILGQFGKHFEDFGTLKKAEDCSDHFYEREVWTDPPSILTSCSFSMGRNKSGQTDPQTNGLTDRPKDRHTVLERCLDASKKRKSK